MIAFIKRHKYIKLFVEVLVLLALVFVIRAYVQRHAVSGEAPIISGQLLDGKPVSLNQYRGAPVLVHFWASWCGICRLEEKGIDAIAMDYPVITVAMQSGNNDEVAAYLQQQGLTFPVLPDPAGKLAARYGVSAVPASFVIDANGKIRFVEFGYTSETGLRMRLWLAAQL